MPNATMILAWPLKFWYPYSALINDYHIIITVTMDTSIRQHRTGNVASSRHKTRTCTKYSGSRQGLLLLNATNLTVHASVF
jgi:hypothetical protein